MIAVRRVWDFYPHPEQCGGDLENCNRCRPGIRVRGQLEQYERCPHEEPIDVDLLRVLALAKRGHLPVDGGTLAQTRAFVRALAVFERETNELENLELAKARNKR